jgi:nucleotide-binding universal stress UspA family protein
MKTIVALVDFSDVTAKVLKQAQTLAEAFRSQVILLRGLQKRPIVVDMGVASPTLLQTLTPEDIEADKARLRQLAEPLNSAGINVSIQQVPDASVEAIVEEAQRLKADVIIVGSHHHGTFYNLIVGSVTSGVLKRAHCPVLVVPND